MSRIFVTNDARTVFAELTVEPFEGAVTAVCDCGWRSEPFAYSLTDVINEVAVHVDQEHQ